MERDWLQIYRNFDDNALAALSSTGLVRRAAKDVEADKVAWASPPDSEQATLRADGQLVTLNPGGPAKASCDCPAPGICKHILAAALWLRAAAPSSAGEAAPVDVLAEVLRLEPAAVFKAAGVAATRKAAALLADTEGAVITDTPGALSIQLPALDVPCLYIAGGGYASMVSEAPAASRAVVHLLAVVAVWRRHGREFAWPEALAATTPAAGPEDGLSDDERQFLVRLRALVLEICHGGWAHVSEIMPAQLRALAMSARIESFQRLAGMLRTLAGTTDLLAKRDLGADERQAIRLAVRIYALSHALEGARGDLLRDLRGAARRSFNGAGTLELLPLGAHWWELRSGARGLTMAFWDPAAQRIMQASLARRDGADRGFNRDMAWSSSTLWPGVGAPCALGDGTLTLSNVRASDDHRISLGAETSAGMLPPWRADDPRWQAAGHDDWTTLAEAIRQGAGLRGEAFNCVLLKPTRFDQPVLDEIRQVSSWTLRDVHDEPLTLRLSCDPEHHLRIDNIQGWAEQGPVIRGVLARLERDLHGCRLEPLSLVIERNGVLRAVSLDYEAPTNRAGMSLLQRIARMFKSGAPATAAAPAAAHSDWLEHLRLTMEDKALTGRLHMTGEDRNSLASMQSFLRASGLDLVADALRRYLDHPGAEQAMALMYLCQACADAGDLASALR
ncbi:SWIM zinc finger family protein [Duganella vulcania]|uniref:SWIM zinc finger family protein n=1 Tax=Duganella vulcania TaxID=2692166 RepID=A0A845GS18_9BURK|nr:SWIM zinc finger family protein [Duganella vulcania]MYM95477.1 SWIM zinc finger family protein [Duganella vulcania]